MFYVVLVQAVLIYGSETCVIPPRIGKMMYRFHHKVILMFMQHRPKRSLDGTWDYPSLEEVMVEAGIQ